MTQRFPLFAILGVCLLASAAPTRAQVTTVFSEDFSAGIGSWSVVKVTTMGGYPTVTTGPSSPDIGLGNSLWFDVPLGTDAYVERSISLPDATPITLSFKTFGAHDPVTATISTSGVVLESFSPLLNQSITTKSYDLSQWKGQNISLRLRATSGGNTGAAAAFDDILITAPPPTGEGSPGSATIAGPLYVPIHIEGDFKLSGANSRGHVSLIRSSSSAPPSTFNDAFSLTTIPDNSNYLAQGWYRPNINGTKFKSGGNEGWAPGPGNWTHYVIDIDAQGNFTARDNADNFVGTVPAADVAGAWYVNIGWTADAGNLVDHRSWSATGGPPPVPDLTTTSVFLDPASPLVACRDLHALKAHIQNNGSASATIPAGTAFSVTVPSGGQPNITDWKTAAPVTIAGGQTGDVATAALDYYGRVGNWSFTFPATNFSALGDANSGNDQRTDNYTFAAPVLANPPIVNGANGISATVTPYASSAGWNSFYPRASFDDDPTRRGSPNFEWDYTASFIGNDLVLGLKNRASPNGGVNSVNVGYSVTLSGTTFADGSTSKTCVLYTGSGGGFPGPDVTQNFALTALKPDLSVTSFTATPSSPVVNQPVSFSLTLKNFGPSDSTGISGTLFVEQSYQAEIVLSPLGGNLPAGQSVTLTGSYTFTAPGTYRIDHHRWSGSPFGFNFSDPNPANDGAALTMIVTAAPVPDIEAQTVSINPASPTAGSEATITLTGKNTGGAATSGNFTIKFYSGATEIASKSYSSAVAAGASFTQEAKYTFTTASTVDLKAVVSDVAGEANAANNDKTLAGLTVAAAPVPDVKLLALTATPSAPYATKVTTLSASYQNIGNLATGPFKVTFYSGSTEIGSKDIATLAPSANGSVDLAYTFTTQGAVTLKATATDIVGEQTTTNNDASLNATVGPPPPEGTLSVSASTIDYGTLKPGDVVTAKNFLATIDGGAGAFDLTVTSNANWFTTDVQKSSSGKVSMPRTGGLFNQTVGIVDVATTGLSDGTHSEVVTVSAPSPIGSKQVTVTIKITNPQPVVSVATTSLDVGSFKAGEAVTQKTIEVENAGSAALTATVASDAAWMTVSPTTITNLAAGAKQTITLTFKTDALSDGAKTGKVTVTGTPTGGSATTNITLTIIKADAAPELKLSATKIDFGSIDLSATTKSEQTLTIRNNGGGKFSWQIEIPASVKWLTASPATAKDMSREQDVKLTLDPAALPEGDQSCEVKVKTTDMTVNQEVTLLVKASGVKVTKSWDLELTPTKIVLNGKPIGRRELDVTSRGGERLNLQIEMTGENHDAALAPKAAIAAVRSWLPGSVTSVGKITGAKSERFTYTESLEMPKATGIYYVALVMGGVEDAEEAAGFDRSSTHGGKGSPIGNGNDIWDITAGQWEGGNGNSFFIHDMDGDGLNRKWPCVVLKVRVTGAEPTKKRLAEGDIVIREITSNGNPSSVDMKIAGDSTGQKLVITGALRNPSGGDKGDATLRCMVVSTMSGGVGSILDAKVAPTKEAAFRVEENLRAPSGDGVFYIGLIMAREDELKELQSGGLSRNNWEEGITEGRSTLMLAVNNNVPADFAIRAIRLVTKQPPQLLAEPKELVLKPSAGQLDATEGRIMIRNLAGGLLEGNAAASDAWVHVTPQAFTANQVELTVRVDVSELLRHRAGHDATPGARPNQPTRIASGILAVTTNGGELTVPIFVELPAGGTLPPEGGVTLLTTKANGPQPTLKWKAQVPGGRYTLIVKDARSGKVGWTKEVGDESEIAYRGIPLLPGHSYIWSLRHESWTKPVEATIEVEKYRIGW